MRKSKFYILSILLAFIISTGVSVRAQNNPPVVHAPIPDQTVYEDDFLNYTFPDTTFNDVDTGDVLTYTATLTDGSSLPAWISFSPGTRTFNYMWPTNSDVGTYTIRVTAKDLLLDSIYDDFDIVNLDNSQPNYPTHIAYGSSTISLIQLPTTLLPSGQIQTADDGSTWTDYKVITTDEGLSKFYLLSSSGDLGIFTINHNLPDTYDEYDLSMSGITHFSMYQSGNDTYFLVEQTTSSHLFLENGTINLLQSIDQQIYSTDELNLVTDFYGDDNPEILLFARNELSIFSSEGELEEIRSFSSTVLQRQLWYPDLTGQPILVADLFTENIEIIMRRMYCTRIPIQREYLSRFQFTIFPINIHLKSAPGS